MTKLAKSGHDRRTLNAAPLKEKSTTSSSHNIANPCAAGDGEESVEDHEVRAYFLTDVVKLLATLVCVRAD